MSLKMKINFKFDENEIKSIEFDIKTNIESMLKTYLNETNSKQSLKNSDILYF
jgi:hypothetical protein